MISLNTRDTYEFFLSEIKPMKRTAGLRMKMVWTATDTDFEIVEWHAYTNNAPGPRMNELAERLGIPVAGIKKGMHIFAKLNRHFQESLDDNIAWELDYETLTLERTKKETIDPSIKKRVLAYALKAKTRDEAATTLKALNPAYIPVLDQLIASGEVVLA